MLLEKVGVHFTALLKALLPVLLAGDALLAVAAPPPVLAEAATTAVFAPAVLPPALSEATAATSLAEAVRRRPCSQMALPPHSLQILRCRPCSQMLAPPHSLQLLRTRPCWHLARLLVGSMYPARSRWFYFCRSNLGPVPVSRHVSRHDSNAAGNKLTCATTSISLRLALSVRATMHQRR